MTPEEFAAECEYLVAAAEDRTIGPDELYLGIRQLHSELPSFPADLQIDWQLEIAHLVLDEWLTLAGDPDDLIGDAYRARARVLASAPDEQTARRTVTEVIQLLEQFGSACEDEHVRLVIGRQCGLVRDRLGPVPMKVQPARLRPAALSWLRAAHDAVTARTRTPSAAEVRSATNGRFGQGTNPRLATGLPDGVVAFDQRAVETINNAFGTAGEQREIVSVAIERQIFTAALQAFAQHQRAAKQPPGAAVIRLDDPDAFAYERLEDGITELFAQRIFDDVAAETKLTEVSPGIEDMPRRYGNPLDVGSAIGFLGDLVGGTGRPPDELLPELVQQSSIGKWQYAAHQFLQANPDSAPGGQPDEARRRLAAGMRAEFNQIPEEFGQLDLEDVTG